MTVMRLDPATGPARSALPAESLRQDARIASLKRALEAQKPEADEAERAALPKGRVVDIRV